MAKHRNVTWWTPAELPPGTAIARQLRLVDALLSGEVAPPIFETEFIEARAKELAEDERPEGNLEAGLSQVFLAVDRYCGDPELRDSDDFDDEQLIEFVREQRRVIYGERDSDW